MTDTHYEQLYVAALKNVQRMQEELAIATEALVKVRTAIIDTAPDTIWVSNACTAVDEIDHALAKLQGAGT